VLHADAPIVVGDIVSRLLTDRSVTAFIVPLPSCQTGGRRALVGATPELLLSRRGSRVRSRPLAGSAKRAADPGEDARAANQLLASEKDRREHATVIEWIADRLAPFCRKLHVPRSPSLVSTATMWHLATDIHGELTTTEASSLELARVLHPTPAVCGYPFDRAVELIGALEFFDRRFYTGTLGWCDATGDGDWYVAIRCADVCGHVAHLYAGAGVVAGSTPEGEAAETAAKFRALLNAIHPGHSDELVDEVL
jgi:isochorismate synthase